MENCKTPKFINLSTHTQKKVENKCYPTSQQLIKWGQDFLSLIDIKKLKICLAICLYKRPASRVCFENLPLYYR